jgi:hypothetical protein
MLNTPSTRRHTPTPYVDIDTTVVLDRALVELADRRFMRPLDPATQLHLLASLIAQTESWVAEQASRARQAGTTWRDIGLLLGLTAAAARQRYGAQARLPLD